MRNTLTQRQKLTVWPRESRGTLAEQVAESWLGLERTAPGEWRRSCVCCDHPSAFVATLTDHGLTASCGACDDPGIPRLAWAALALARRTRRRCAS